MCADNQKIQLTVDNWFVHGGVQQAKSFEVELHNYMSGQMRAGDKAELHMKVRDVGKPGDPYKVEILGSVSSESVLELFKEAMVTLRMKFNAVFTDDQVKVSEPEKAEPDPLPNAPLTDAQIARAVDKFLWMNVESSSLPGEVFDVKGKSVNGKVTLSGSTNSVMLRRKLDEVLSKAKAEIKEIVSIDASGVPWP